MKQIKWVVIMVTIVIVVLGVLVVLLWIEDRGKDFPDATPTPAPTASSAGAASGETPVPEQPQVTPTPAPTATPAAVSYVFPIYIDAPVHYGDIAYMGNSNNGDDGSMMIDPGCADNPHSGGSCICITYDPPSTGHWAGMMWLSGVDNFPPSLPVDGVDAAQANRLTFYARGLGSVKFFIENENKQQVTRSVQLTPDWTQYTLDIPSDWDQVCVGFGFASNGAAGKSTIYLDDIEFNN